MKKHILCIGDSNTHGLCTDPSESADHGSRYNEEERWTCLLQKALGEEYLVIEEGLSGRTCVYDDPDMDSVNLLPVLHALLNSHEPLDLLILMLGTNDSKVKFNTDARKQVPVFEGFPRQSPVETVYPPVRFPLPDLPAASLFLPYSFLTLISRFYGEKPVCSRTAGWSPHMDQHLWDYL